MTNLSVDVQWTSKMAFKTNVNGHEIILDADEQVGGSDLGPRPKPLLMVALAGCTGMDVISLLRKMRVEVDYFNVKAEGELTEEHPKHFAKIHLIYEFKGKDLPMESLEKAVSLSQEKYCGVSETLKKAVELSYEIKILD